MYSSSNTFRRRWTLNLYWRSCFKTNDDEPRFSQTELGTHDGRCGVWGLGAQSINAFSAVLSTKGRVIGLSWANSYLKDLKDHREAPRPHPPRNECLPPHAPPRPPPLHHPTRDGRFKVRGVLNLTVKMCWTYSAPRVTAHPLNPTCPHT